MKYSINRKLFCEFSKLSKLNAYILLGYQTNTDAPILVYKLVSICTQIYATAISFPCISLIRPNSFSKSQLQGALPLSLGTFAFFNLIFSYAQGMELKLKICNLCSEIIFLPIELLSIYPKCKMTGLFALDSILKEVSENNGRHMAQACDVSKPSASTLIK